MIALRGLRVAVPACDDEPLGRELFVLLESKLDGLAAASTAALAEEPPLHPGRSDALGGLPDDVIHIAQEVAPIVETAGQEPDPLI